MCIAAMTVVFGIGSAAVASASAIAIGIVSWDVNFPGNAGQFDIINLTGANSSGDAAFPVTTPVNLASLGLHVDFVNGSSTNFGSSYFSLGLDGLSFDGSPIAIGGANPLPTQGILTGTLSPLTFTLFDGSSVTVLPGFTATVLPSSGRTLQDGDFAVIFAQTTTAGGGGDATVPEPGTMVLLGAGVMGLVLARKRFHGARP
jgi:hypothetical protein